MFTMFITLHTNFKTR